MHGFETEPAEAIAMGVFFNSMDFATVTPSFVTCRSGMKACTQKEGQGFRTRLSFFGNVGSSHWPGGPFGTWNPFVPGLPFAPGSPRARLPRDRQTDTCMSHTSNEIVSMRVHSGTFVAGISRQAYYFGPIYILRITPYMLNVTRCTLRITR